MNIDRNMADLICLLEFKIGNQTYNPNSYNGWTGEEGCNYRYPVCFCSDKSDKENHILSKTKSQIDSIEAECIDTMKYTFGSNHLYIGDGLVSVLNCLEDLYEIDFNALEGERSKKRIAAMKRMEETLNEGLTVEIGPGEKKIGTDIPCGSFIMINPNAPDRYLSVDILDREKHREAYILFANKEEPVFLQDGFILKSRCNYILKKPSGKINPKKMYWNSSVDHVRHRF